MSSDDDLIQRASDAIPIQPFDFKRDSNINMRACSFAVIGSSKSGKTTFLKYLIKHHFKDDIKVLMSQSLQNDIYDSMKQDDMAVCPGYSPDIIKEMYRINKKTRNHYEFCVVIDDLVGAKNDQQMMKLLALYRNSRISGIVVGQDSTMLNPTGRANVNHAILGYQNTDGRCEDNIKAYLRSYFPRYLTMDQKIKLYKALTQDHCFLWINNLENSIKRIKLSPEQLLAYESDSD
jgi:GTPase SAR1 family protein